MFCGYIFFFPQKMNGGIAGGQMSFFQSLFIFLFSQGRYRHHENEERWDFENFDNFIGAVMRIALMRNDIFASWSGMRMNGLGSRVGWTGMRK